jgi:hypothetical protein
MPSKHPHNYGGVWMVKIEKNYFPDIVSGFFFFRFLPSKHPHNYGGVWMAFFFRFFDFFLIDLFIRVVFF